MTLDSDNMAVGIVEMPWNTLLRYGVYSVFLKPGLSLEDAVKAYVGRIGKMYIIGDKWYHVNADMEIGIKGEPRVKFGDVGYVKAYNTVQEYVRSTYNKDLRDDVTGEIAKMLSAELEGLSGMVDETTGEERRFGSAVVGEDSAGQEEDDEDNGCRTRK
jgi:hypothetical protein